MMTALNTELFVHESASGLATQHWPTAASNLPAREALPCTRFVSYLCGIPCGSENLLAVFQQFIGAGGTCIATCAEDREPHLPSSCGRVSDEEHYSKFRSSAALNGTSCAGEQMGGTARMIYEHFCSNRGFAAATNLDAVGTASR